MATSGTSAFNLDILEIVEEAYEQVGKEMRTGYELRSARRSLQLLMLEWANMGINLWTVSNDTVSLVDGTANYSLATDFTGLLDGVIRTGSGTSQTDYRLTRIDVADYAQRSKKNIESRPTEFYVDRQIAPTVTFWPVPDSNDYTFVYWYLRRIYDAGDNTNNYDVPDRFLPALISGLAFNLAVKTPGAESRVPALKTLYDEKFRLAAEEDRPKTDSFLLPHVGSL